MSMSLIIFFTLLLIHDIHAKPHGLTTDSSPNCSCYTTTDPSSNTSTSFQQYRFYDFRSVAEFAGQYADVPPLLMNGSSSGGEGNATSEQAYFTSDKWKGDWIVGSGSGSVNIDGSESGTNGMLNTANVYISQETTVAYPNPNDPNWHNTALVLRTAHLPSTQSGAQISTLRHDISSASVRMRARLSGDVGALAFVEWDGNESISSEIGISATEAAERYSYGNGTNFASEKRNEWHTHRMDLFGDQDVFFRDGQVVASVTEESVNDLGTLSVGFGGNMTVGRQAILQILWIEMVFNTSGSGDTGRCGIVCSVDGEQFLGVPAVANGVGTRGFVGCSIFLGLFVIMLDIWIVGW